MQGEKDAEEETVADFKNLPLFSCFTFSSVCKVKTVQQKIHIH